MSSNSKQNDFPIHRAIWRNDIGGLKSQLSAAIVTEADVVEPIASGNNSCCRSPLEIKDPRGRTPLMLAVTLGHFECVKLLLAKKADANVENRQYWTITHEATAVGDPELLKLVLHHRKHQRIIRLGRALRRLLKQLQDSPDFYVEMKWKFSSWIPFVSQICPNDTYKIYKSGTSVRVDTTLAGFDMSAAPTSGQTSATGQWVRGNLSYRFRLPHVLPSAEILVVDHDHACVTVVEQFSPEQLNLEVGGENDQTFAQHEPSVTDVAQRLSTPASTTYVDVDKIAFERNKTGGIMSWFTDTAEKTQDVNGYECKVYTATNVNLVTKTRTEHLTKEDKEAHEQLTKETQSFMGVNFGEMVFGKQTSESQSATLHNDYVTTTNPYGISEDEYFNEYVDLGNRDIGRPKEVAVRSNSFKATMSLADDFPLDLHDQILPIVDLMATSNAHFARLKNFIELQLPAGFPVRIEIPLFHVFTAEVSFGNVHAMEKPVEGITTPRLDEESTETPICVISPEVFDIPEHYERFDDSSSNRRPTGRRRRQRYTGGFDQSPDVEDDLMLRMAIQESLMEQHRGAGNNIDNAAAVGLSADELALQRAITDSLQPSGTAAMGSTATSHQPNMNNSLAEAEAALSQLEDDDVTIRHVIEESVREQKERAERERLEEEELKKIIELSLVDK